MEERIPQSPIVRRPYCSPLASASVRVCVCARYYCVSRCLHCVLMHIMAVSSSRVCVSVTAEQQLKRQPGRRRVYSWPIKTTGLRALGPAIRAQHWQLFHLEALSVKWTLSLKCVCTRVHSQFCVCVCAEVILEALQIYGSTSACLSIKD